MNRSLKSLTASLLAATIGGCALPAGHGMNDSRTPDAPATPATAAVSSVGSSTAPSRPPTPEVARPQQHAAATSAVSEATVRPVGYAAAATDQPPLHTGTPAYSHGYTAPAYGQPAYGPAAYGQPAHAAPHGGVPCTAGCCGAAAPVYPTMPPISRFGIDPQEFLCDGGDQSPAARVRQDHAIIGVDLEDTVVKYRTPKGDINVTASNRVCIYAPRFAAVRRVAGAVTEDQVTGPIGYYQPDAVGDVLAPLPSSTVMNPVSPHDSDLARGPDALRTRDAGVPVDNVVGPEMEAAKVALLANLAIVSDGVLRDADKPWLAKGAAAAITWSKDQSPHVAVRDITPSVATVDVAAQGFTVYDLPGGRLRVIKLADRDSAQVGDIVTFVLRIDNTGEGSLDEVVITDNLTTRLEYVEDSQTCTKGVQFETSVNDGGSLRLTWTFTDNFEVGESAIIRFRCRVR